MSIELVVVESPAKAKTIKKYLGKGFEVIASYGHVRDLRPKAGAVIPENNFEMIYEAIAKNEKHAATIIAQVKKADTIYLATDPDREGEAISWHIVELLKKAKVLKAKPVHRVVFHEITKSAITDAIKNPRTISMDLVNAQQARRALDYLVGFKLSPLLWKKIRRGLSAGRVQSPALRLIVEREEEIARFISQEYWTISAQTAAKDQPFSARLYTYQHKKVEQFDFNNETLSRAAKKYLIDAAQGFLDVKTVTKKQRKRQPAAPFITSTLQQEGVRKLGFTASRTMRAAQQLYEAGYISYMRTDSVNLAQEAIDDIRLYIGERYGQDFVPPTVNTFRTKSKNAQEAHEAIRPTSIRQTPESLSSLLNDEQLKLYQLIWQRTLACQMVFALMDTVTAELAAGTDNVFRATGSTIRHPGFLSVYQESLDDNAQQEKENLLPPMQVGDRLPLKEVITEQHFTEPPPRFNEATLVKTLEEFGIGRPSTYASIIATLQARDYVILDQRRFKPTDVGCIVNKFLTQYFTKYVDFHFTANLEDELDAIARGEKEWLPVLENFWAPFRDLIAATETQVQRSDVTQESLDENCPKCEKPLSIRLGKRGKFIGCTGFPECDYTRNVDGNDDSSETTPEIIADRKCPECQSDLQIKQGRYGKFIGCTGYPKCHFIESLQKPEDTGITCPTCHAGNLVKRRSRRGFFYSCDKYPECKYAVWNEPLKIVCPQCHWPLLTVKVTKRKGTEKVCPQKNCDYAAPLEKDDG